MTLFPSLSLFALTACERPAVDWREPVAIGAPSSGFRLSVDAAGDAAFVPDSVRAAAPPQSTGLCARSVRIALGVGRLHAVWWNVRGDSSAALYASASPDSGRTWESPVAVDTSDVSSRGCDRPSPSLATIGDDIYVAYSMIAPEGTGVFFAHTMASMLHSPVAVLYGERLVSTAIAVAAERVAVAYEQPNGKRAGIDVAVSSTQGHIFESRVTATRGVDAGTAPRVALTDHAIAVSWTATAFGGGTPSRVVRTGRLQ